MKLVIGNKRYSSWSLRPWLLMKHFNIDFEEILVPLDQPETHETIKRYSKAAKVPVLIDGELVIWESLAIAEYLNEVFPEKMMWPKDRSARAHARAISNEMHSGFQNLRHFLSHDIQKHVPGFDASPAKDDIARVKDIWSECLAISGGPYLFGHFSIADAMYAPVVNRFVSYDVDFGVNAAYCHRMLKLPSHALWIEQAKADKLKMPKYD